MQTLSSIRNPQIQLLRTLHDAKGRRQHGITLACGETLVREALQDASVTLLLLDTTRCEPYAHYVREAEAKNIPVYDAPVHVLEAVTGEKTPQGIAAALRIPPSPTLTMLGRHILALEDVQDPGNVGTMLRTAEAAGVSGALLTEGCADPFSPRGIRASMGSSMRLPILRDDCFIQHLHTLQGTGMDILSTEMSGESIRQAAVQPSWALVVGNEARGVSAEISKMATQCVSLPMRGRAESLNAAVAAGIFLYSLPYDDENSKTHQMP